jgi:hypothetical protein
MLAEAVKFSLFEFAAALAFPVVLSASDPFPVLAN